SITAIQVVGGQIHSTNKLGFDAVELRVEDRILPGTPDLSPDGLLATIGVADGNAEVRMGPVRTILTANINPVPIDPTSPDATNLWAQVLLEPGDSFEARGATVLGADMHAPSLLGDSFFTVGGALPYHPDITRNYQIRLL